MNGARAEGRSRLNRVILLMLPRSRRRNRLAEEMPAEMADAVEAMIAESGHADRLHPLPSMSPIRLRAPVAATSLRPSPESTSVPPGERDAQSAWFDLAVPAGGEARLTYTVRYRWAPDVRID